MRLWLDFETFSPNPITHGTARYAERSRIMLTAYAVDNGPVHVLQGDPRKNSEFMAALAAATEVWAHNAWFDRTNADAAGLGIPLEKWRCSMALALMHALPGGLGALGAALNVPSDKAKDQEGGALMRLFCVPVKGTELPAATPESEPVKWARFMAYAGRDVEAMRECVRRIHNVNYTPSEISLWHLDQRINSRGFAVDVAQAQGAVNAVARETKLLVAQAKRISGGVVRSLSKRMQFIDQLLFSFGYPLADATASTIERAIDDPSIDPVVRDLLLLKLATSKSSVSKYKAILRSVSSDGRLRGTLQFSGARRTRRWAGRLFQPQNLPIPERDYEEILLAIERMKTDVLDILDDDPIAAASDSLRSVIIAAPGRKIVAADLSNIEGRVAAWLGGEQWKLDAFAAFDRGEGPDLYKVAYARTFGGDAEDIGKDWRRQLGKVLELAFQFGGGVGAFVVAALKFGFDLAELADRVHAMIDAEMLDECTRFYEWSVQEKRTYGLPERQFTACDAIKRLWRAAHPGIVGLWGTLLECAAVALRTGDAVVSPHLVFVRRKAWLYLQLPSGQHVCYPGAKAVTDDRGRVALDYLGVDKANRWARIGTHGGKVFENAVQATARDILASGMLDAEAEGYPLVLTVHDEVVSEPPGDDAYTHQALAAIISLGCAWTAGLPIAAAGFSGPRYKKD